MGLTHEEIKRRSTKYQVNEEVAKAITEGRPVKAIKAFDKVPHGRLI